MRRWLLLFALVPNCTGCLAYAYPSMAYTPEVAIENRDLAAHAFRVDIDRTERTPGATTVSGPFAPPVSAQYTLTRIPIDRGGVIPSQLEIAATTGVYDPFNVIQNVNHEKTQYTMTVRVYKPGSQTMEVHAWDKAAALPWRPAPTLLDQEKALDDLLADPTAPRPTQVQIPAPGNWWDLKGDPKTQKFGLQPGSASMNQREFLTFVSGEYTRLANSPAANAPNMQALRERLRQKAVWLLSYADQRPVDPR